MIRTLLKTRLLRFAGVRGLRPPIFIVGCGHTGTSYLQTLLEYHPGIHVVRYETNLGMVRFLKAVLIAARARRACCSSDSQRWLEKIPRHIHRVQVLRDAFPQARFLIMVRDGRDVVASLKKRYGDTTQSVNRWVADTQASLAQSYRSDYRIVRYEDLIERGPEEVVKILEFLNENKVDLIEAYNSARSNFPLKDAPDPVTQHAEYRKWQMSQPTFDGRARWKEQLTTQDIEIFKLHANALLMELRYEFVPDW